MLVKNTWLKINVYQHHKGETIATSGILQPLPISNAWIDISMDFIDVHSPSQGNIIIFVVVDCLIKYAYCSAI